MTPPRRWTLNQSWSSGRSMLPKLEPPIAIVPDVEVLELKSSDMVCHLVAEARTMCAREDKAYAARCADDVMSCTVNALWSLSARRRRDVSACAKRTSAFLTFARPEDVAKRPHPPFGG